MKHSKIFLKGNNKDLSTVFDGVFKENLWGSSESKSGMGSNIQNTRHILSGIKTIIQEYNIKTFLDVPCGDCNWIDPNNLGCEYIGADIVQDLIDNNKSKLPGIEFQKIDLTTDKIPQVDLIMCRECLQHLSFENGKKAINNIINSGSKYLLVTHYSNGENKDIMNGMYYEMNLLQPPFNFGTPITSIEEKDNNLFYKTNNLEYLYLYEIDKLKQF
ncbi:MAG: class I SAM-dependent methyltransferase [Candidatus Absconditabacteria bacterium]